MTRRVPALCLLLVLSSGCSGLLSYAPLGARGTAQGECRPGSRSYDLQDDPEARRPAVAVVVVSIDGLRPDFVTPELMPTLARLRAEGISAREARTVRPSQTLPSHVSMWTGVPVTTHGIDWNENRTDETGPVGLPTAFDHARAAGFATAAIVGKAKLRHLFRPGALDVARAPSSREVLGAPLPSEVEGATKIARRAGALFREHRPDLTFLHFADPDAVGHVFGWGGRVYRRAVRQSDRALSRVVQEASCSYGQDLVVIVTADHGGEGRTHAAGREVDVRIPWIAWSPKRQTGSLEVEVTTCDTGATALALLGVSAPAAWEGVPLLAYDPVRGITASGNSANEDRCR